MNRRAKIVIAVLSLLLICTAGIAVTALSQASAAQDDVRRLQADLRARPPMGSCPMTLSKGYGSALSRVWQRAEQEGVCSRLSQGEWDTWTLDEIEKIEREQGPVPGIVTRTKAHDCAPVA